MHHILDKILTMVHNYTQIRIFWNFIERMNNFMQKAYLVLANEYIFEGYSFGAPITSIGELVFTTGMGGYIETLTDPSYNGQIVMQTFPLIGNYGIIEDDFESEFSVSAKPTETLFAASTDDNIIYLNTFSQTISPSLRVGYMVLPEKLVAPFQQKLGFYSCTVPTFEQYVLAELLQSGDFERHINRVRRLMRRNLAST